MWFFHDIYQTNSFAYLEHSYKSFGPISWVNMEKLSIFRTNRTIKKEIVLNFPFSQTTFFYLWHCYRFQLDDTFRFFQIPITNIAPGLINVYFWARKNKDIFYLLKFAGDRFDWPFNILTNFSSLSWDFMGFCDDLGWNLRSVGRKLMDFMEICLWWILHPGPRWKMSCCFLILRS